MIVDLFIPCFMDQLYPQTAWNVVKILEKIGCGVHYNPAQTCCGQPAFNAGYWKEAREVGEKFIKDFPNDRYIVCPSASCAGFVKNYLSEMFLNSTLHHAYRQIQRNIYELSDFLVNVLKITHLGASLKGIATYHDSCSALREYGIKREPRILLQHVHHLELREMEDTESCCGFGGTFAAKFEPISVSMTEQKINHALSVNADYIVSTDISCLMQLESYIKKKKCSLRVMHLADVLVSGWG